MSVPYMTSGPVAVTSGQPLTPWIPARGARIVNFVLYCEDATLTGHMVLEAAQELDGNGNAIKSELIDPTADVTVTPTEPQRTYTIKNCQYPYVRLGARGDAPSFPSTLVRGGIEVTQ